MTADYNSLAKLWNDYQAGLEDHDCSYSAEEFVSCPLCNDSQQAWYKLQCRLDKILPLLEKYHDRLLDLATATVQEVEPPRPPRLQESLLLALALLGKNFGVMSDGTDSHH